MKIQVKNLGVLKQANFELGDLTVICGPNNTGKTYATYALYGFLSTWRAHWRQAQMPPINVERLFQKGSMDIRVERFIERADIYLKQLCNKYSKSLSRVFASSESKFKNSEFEVILDKSYFQLDKFFETEPFEKTIGSTKSPIFNIRKEADQPNLSITLLVEKDQVDIPSYLIKRAVIDAIGDIIFSHIFPVPFISSAERTGAAIFRKELNFKRNRLLEAMSKVDDKTDPFNLLFKFYSDYALPVKANVDFTRDLEDLVKKESFIMKEHPSVLKEFSSIIGGEYRVSKDDELSYIPTTNKNLRLDMDESSSAVRSLLDIGFYLRHVARKGELLMIDEPELNLHPENQRRVARLLSKLVNLGIMVFITTHSDYILKEFNTLIMLNQDKQYLKDIMKREKYIEEELLDAGKVKVFMTEENLVLLEGKKRRKKCYTLVPAEIDPQFGIAASSFDKTIEEMNRIQEEIVFYEEELE